MARSYGRPSEPTGQKAKGPPKRPLESVPKEGVEGLPGAAKRAESTVRPDEGAEVLRPAADGSPALDTLEGRLSFALAKAGEAGQCDVVSELGRKLADLLPLLRAVSPAAKSG